MDKKTETKAARLIDHYFRQLKDGKKVEPGLKFTFEATIKGKKKVELKVLYICDDIQIGSSIINMKTKHFNFLTSIKAIVITGFVGDLNALMPNN